MKILIAEDDKTSQFLLSKFLSDTNEITLASNGIEAIETFVKAHEAQSPFELILVDIMMPKLDGLELIKLVRTYEKKQRVRKSLHVKLIIVSALKNKEILDIANENLVDQYYMKPLDLVNLKKIIEELES